MSTLNDPQPDQDHPAGRPRGPRVRNDRTSGAEHVRAAALDLLRLHARLNATHLEQRTDVVNAGRRAGLTWDEIALILGYGSGDTMRVAHLRAGGER